MPTVYSPPVSTSCYAPNKPSSDGYVRKNVWNKELKKYQTFKMHRWVYAQAFGEIPEGYQIDHMCHNEAVARGECEGGQKCPHRACVNPAHLRAVTRSENQRAGLAGLDNRTHCRARGHELTEQTIKVTIRDGKEQKVCLECQRINNKMGMRRLRERKQAEIANSL